MCLATGFLLYFRLCMSLLGQIIPLCKNTTVRGSKTGGGRDFLHLSWGPPSLLYKGCRVFPGGKVRPGREADPSPPSGAKVKNRVQLYL